MLNLLTDTSYCGHRASRRLQRTAELLAKADSNFNAHEVTSADISNCTSLMLIDLEDGSTNLEERARESERE